MPERKDVIRMGLYQDVKDEVSTREAAERYGFQVRRNGMMCCPFHDDRHPSMKVDRNFICFGCQSSIVERLWALEPVVASELASFMTLSKQCNSEPLQHKWAESDLRWLRGFVRR